MRSDTGARMVPGGDDRDWRPLVTLHALGWLVVGCAVGLLLSVLLLLPELGDRLAPFTYGRWVPVHFNSLLYGWLSFPLIGVLFRVYLPRAERGSGARIAVGAWSGSLLFACVSWVAGHSSGKLFLEWTGPARGLLAVSMAVLTFVLLSSFRRRRAIERKERQGKAERSILVVSKWALLWALGAVPAVMYWASGPEVYPSINPDSGGATGGSLLGSTLGIIAVIWLCPLMAGIPLRRGKPPFTVPTGIVLVLHFAIFALLDHGNHSHHEISQILALASLIVWPPLLARYLGSFDWSVASRRWLVALCAWGSVLVVTAVTMFLPGILEQWKYTNALVGHAHLAMAGAVTSFVVVLLCSLNRGTRLESPFSGTGAFASWHVGLLLQILALSTLGSIERVHPGWLYRSEWLVDALYLARLVGGAMMLVASLIWIGAAFQALEHQRTTRLATDERARAVA